MLGEPFIGLMTRTEAAGLLSNSGWAIVDDSGVEDWRQRYIGTVKQPSRFPERIAVGERQA